MRPFSPLVLVCATLAADVVAAQDTAPRGPLRETGQGESATAYVLEQSGPRTGMVETWQWLVFPEPVSSRHGRIDALAVRTIVDCEAGTLRPVGFEAYRDGRRIAAEADDSFAAARPDSESAEAGAVTATCHGPGDHARFERVEDVEPRVFGAWVPVDMGGLTLYPGGPPEAVMVSEGTFRRGPGGEVSAVLLKTNGDAGAPAVIGFELDCAALTYRRTGQWALRTDDALGVRLGGAPEPIRPFSDISWLPQAARVLCSSDPMPRALPRHGSLQEAQIAGGMNQMLREASEGR